MKNPETNIIIKEVKKTAKYYIANKEVLRKNARNKQRNLSENGKEKKTKYHGDRYHMNIDLNEKLKQNQRKFYASKKIKE